MRGGSELIQTQSGTVSSTLMTEQLKTIPLPTRNALYAVNLLPGVDTTGTVRDASIAGLPEQTINITLDGVNVNNNQDRAGDGFYAMVRPQLDAIEQVTLTTATQGAESAGQGAVQIRFVTRSGTNAYRGTLYDYMRHPSLNTNSWINEKNNLDKNRIILHQAGGSLGGPIYIPECVRRARQGVLLLQLRRVLSADGGDAHADAPQRERGAGLLHVHGRRAAADGERDGRRGARPATRRRSIR